jgi:prolyl-tRNA synthetase
MLTDIVLAQPGQQCPHCDRLLESTRGVEVGHIFKLGTFYSESLGALYLDQHGQQHPIIMGCYGIGVGRLLAAAIEQNHDDKGIVFPTTVAPYQAHLVGLNLADAAVAAAAEQLYKDLWGQGIEVLYDDRPDQAAGVKLNDADLLGLPVRLVVSPRNVNNGVVEIKGRREDAASLVPVDQVREALGTYLAPSV